MQESNMVFKRTPVRIWMISIMNSLRFNVNINCVYLPEPDDPELEQLQPQILCIPNSM